MGIRVGIDLGTTFSAVARINPDTGKPEIIKNSFGDTITPSVLYFEKNGNILFGEDAKNRLSTGDESTIAFFKRQMGDANFTVDFWGKNYNATDLSALFLKKLKTEAENEIGEKIDDAVITVPAYFTHKERQATIDAGKRAGWNVLAIINEPTAAAFAYGLNGKNQEQTVLIYDLGGGTFDVTIAKINKDLIDIIGSDGNHELGGKDWDDCIARYLVQEFEENYHVDISEDTKLITSLLVTAEMAKKQLTALDTVDVPIIYRDIQGSVRITETIFEEISRFLIGETKDVTQRLIDSVGMTWSAIDGVILVGGSTRMRMVHSYVKEMSGKEPLAGVNVDEAVALGAAIRANIDEKGQSISAGILGTLLQTKTLTTIQGAKAISDVTSHALGMISINQEGNQFINSVMIGKNTTIPAENVRSYNFRTRAKDNELEVYVLQGAHLRPLDNVIIAKYVITKIEKTAHNPSIIDVHYKYTANGVVEVTATQKDTGKNLPIKIQTIPEDMSWTDRSPKELQQNEAVPTVDVIMAIDLSGSMAGTPLLKSQQAIKDFIKQMDDSNVKIGVMAFADQVKIFLEPTSNFAKVEQIVDNLAVKEVGIGNEAEPFSLAYSAFKSSRSDIKYLVVLTDGRWQDPKYAINQAKKCHNGAIEIMAIGFDGADFNFLKKIASTDDFASLTNLTDLSSSFSKIAQTIGENTAGNGLKMI